MGLSLPHLIILALVVLVLFGRGRISEMMGDFGKGIKSFKQGLNEEDKVAAPPPAQITQGTASVPPAQAQQHQPHQHQPATLNGDTVVDPNQPGPR